MKYSFRKQNCNKNSIPRSGIYISLKVFLCLFLTVALTGTGVIIPAADMAAAEIPRELDDVAAVDELTDSVRVSDETNEPVAAGDQDFTEEEPEYEELEDVIEEMTEEEEETDASGDAARPDDAENGMEEDTLFADEDGLIMDPDLREGPGETDSDVIGGESLAAGEMFTVTIDDPIVSNPDEISGSAGNRKKGFRSAGIFTSFYDQLEDQAKFFYNLRKSWFADERRTGRLEQPLSRNETDAAKTGNPVSPCHFECDIIPKTDAEGNITYAFDYTCDGFKAGYEEILYCVRASFDAFYYDHPEVFWTRSTSLGFSFGGYNVDNVSMTATMYLAKITLNPVPAYDNAASQVAAFDQAVTETAEQISAGSDYDGDGTVSRPELLQGIHDFLCLKCYYDDEGLAAYKTTQDYSIFTPGPVFLEARAGVVCEGYSRAFKILCDRLGFDCAIVSGKAHTYSTIGHAWNAVNLSGNWYMVDTTWDDVAESQEEIKYQYYLCALNIPNYGSNQLSDRAVNGKIGGNDTTGKTSAGLTVMTRKKEFFFPTYWSGTHVFVQSGVDSVSGEGDGQGIPACITLYACSETGHETVLYYQVGHDWDDGLIETVPTCEGTGTKRYTCRNNQNHTKTVIIPAAGHDWGDGVILSDATCTLPGTIRYVCGNDSSHVLEEKIPIDPDAHDWDEGVVAKTPTCSEAGIRSYTCSRNENHIRTEDIPVDAEAHDWGEGVVTKAPTCTRPGIRTYTCSHDQDHTKTEEISADAEAHDWGEGIVEKAPTCAQTGIRTYTCSLDPKHIKTQVLPVDPEAHEWGKWTIIKPAAAGENGIQIRVCLHQKSHIQANIIPAVTENTPSAVPAEETDSSAVNGGSGALIAIPAKPVLRSVAAKSSQKALVKWKKLKGISGYELQYSISRKFKKKKTVTVTVGSSRYCKITRRLRKGRRYYFRVRAFTRARDLRIYGAWSRVRSLKIR